MDILQETFTESLNAGASPITYEGNEGKEQQVAQAIWDKLPPQMRMQFGSFSQFFSSGAWKKVLQAMQQQMQGGQEEIQETETVETAPQQGLGSMMPGPRTMAHGGIMNAAPRQGYFLGDIVSAITKPVKKVLKSPIGKAAVLGGLGSWGLGMGPLGGVAGSGWLKGPMMQKMLLNKGATEWSLGNLNPFKVAGIGATLAPFGMQAAGKWDKGPEAFERLGGKFDFDYGQMREDISEAVSDGDYSKFVEVLAKYNLTEGQQVPFWDTLRTGSAQGGRIGYQDGGDAGEWYEYHAERLFGKPYHELTETELIMFKEEMGRAQGGRIGYDNGGISTMMASASNPMDDKNQISHMLFGKGLHELTPDEEMMLDDWLEDKAQKWQGAVGGRVAAQEGGLMSLGGMEMDLRGGGFVPLGAKEKADDVPARLSKNEFVFTADAVRAAGGGDVDAGADKMYNTMKQLESRVG